MITTSLVFGSIALNTGQAEASWWNDAYNSFRNAAVAGSKEAIKVTIVALPFSATGVPPAVGGAGFAYGFLNYYF
jgi:hypothetical protein